MAEMVYNGITLSYLTTNRVEQTPIYDQTDTDFLYMKFSFHVTAILITFTPGQPAGTGTGMGQAVQQAAQIRHALAQPRGQFSYSENGVPYIVVPAGGDDANGPKPRGEPIVTPVTQAAFWIEFSIDVFLVDCPGGPNTSYIQYLSNRYTQTQSIDHRGFTTFTISGRLYTRTSIGKLAGPDALRGLVTPAARNGFFRDSSYTLQADGLAMDYTITDKQQYNMPPPFCVNANGKYQVSTSIGGKMFIDVSVHLEGQINVNQTQLMTWAIAIAQTRLSALGSPKAGTATPKLPQIMSGVMSQGLYENTVDVSFRVLQIASGIGNKAQAPGGNWWSGLASVAGGVGNALINGPTQVIADITKALTGANAAAAANGQNVATQPGLNFSTGFFASGVLGSNPQTPGTLDPGLYGNMAGFPFVAAAFGDPCTEQYTSVLRGTTGATIGSTGSTGASTVSSVFNQNNSSPSSSIAPQLTGVSNVQVVTTIPAEVPAGNALISDPNPGIWEEFYAEMEYPNLSGMNALPSTKVGTSTAFISSFNSYTQMKVRWTGRKYGGEPSMPPTNTSDSNLTYLDGVLLQPHVDLAADGVTVIYTNGGEYRYGVADDSKLDKIAPIPPWMTVTQSQLASAVFDPNIDAGTASQTSTLSNLPPGPNA